MDEKELEELTEAIELKRSGLIKAGHAKWLYQTNKTAAQLSSNLLEARFKLDSLRPPNVPTVMIHAWDDATQALIDAAMQRVLPDLLDEYKENIVTVVADHAKTDAMYRARIEALEAEVYAVREASDEWRERALDALVNKEYGRGVIYESCPVCGSHGHIVNFAPRVDTSDIQWACQACDTHFKSPVMLQRLVLK